ncbi:MAG TPA: hypothetical protein VFG92_01310 [Agromyces sp.]|nr:hypothetical protein [Agromyces sp.]
MGIFVFGLWLMGISVSLPGFEAVTFFGGIICASIALAIPMNILGRSDGA